ncbi:squalene/phytoene synthase family protein [Marinivivus vitaminiproducens]|uniref:squalene/phytoene synthase family protein n=1 Tax=Marinivivus vitaminiproducens TaxID=3035935 RepID=UPI002798BB01|nr:squalene/phytoene synthase family protein [Geminicoccaceae bacterium SCSIO 64248]
MTEFNPTMRLRAANRHVHRIVQRSGSSFVWPMRLQARPAREAIFAVYAAARLWDDIADGDLPSSAKRAGLDRWRAEVERIYDGRARSRLGIALAPAIERFDLPKTTFLELIDGMAMDADRPIVAPDMATLRLYCHRVAGTVGILCVRIFGRPDATAASLAESFGLAFQLTNILRDVREDAERGRLYLPRESLDAAGVPVQGALLPAMIEHPGLATACNAVADTAEAAFARGHALAAEGGRQRLGPALRMAALYRLRLEALRTRGFASLDSVRLRRRDRLRALLMPSLSR